MSGQGTTATAVRASRSGVVEPGPGALPASGDAVLGGDAPRAVPPGHARVHGVLRDAARRDGDAVRQRLRVQHDAAGTRRGDPAALRARRGGVGAQGLARAAARVGRDVQAGRDQDPPRAAVGRRRRALRRRAGRVPHPLSRAPLADDLPAHALHRVGDAAGRRPARAPRGVDRASRRPTRSR